MKVLRTIIAFSALALLHCVGGDPRLPDLTCRIEPLIGAECTAVPSLQSGELQLNASGSFEGSAVYESCYGGEEIQMEGEYRTIPHPGGVDLELLASDVVGSDEASGEFPRTVATVSLDPETWSGRITDTAMTIRSRGMTGVAPNVLQLSCSSQ